MMFFKTRVGVFSTRHVSYSSSKDQLIVEVLNGDLSNGEFLNGEVSNGDFSNGKVSNGDFLNGGFSNGEVMPENSRRRSFAGDFSAENSRWRLFGGEVSREISRRRLAKVHFTMGKPATKRQNGMSLLLFLYLVSFPKIFCCSILLFIVMCPGNLTQ